MHERPGVAVPMWLWGPEKWGRCANDNRGQVRIIRMSLDEGTFVQAPAKRHPETRNLLGLCNSETSVAAQSFSCLEPSAAGSSGALAS
jgi:hypothetical protein